MATTDPAADVGDGLDVYGRIVADEARRRGIAVTVLDPEENLLRLSYEGRSVLTLDALSELTSAVSMTCCQDKLLTRRVLLRAGLRVPQGQAATFDGADAAFLDDVGDVVVKPARGEEGHGVSVGVRTVEQLDRALDEARRFGPQVLLEEHLGGQDLRVIVMEHELVAAAVRRPAQVVGDGRRTVGALIEEQSRRRAEETHGASTIPVDDHTRDSVAAAGHTFDDVLAEGAVLQVRRTANVHTGGTMHDVTDRLHPVVVDACTRASRALDIPLVGLDLAVPEIDGDEHAFIEANERPGLTYHDPQPTVQRFLDLLFPETR